MPRDWELTSDQIENWMQDGGTWDDLHPPARVIIFVCNECLQEQSVTITGKSEDEAQNLRDFIDDGTDLLGPYTCAECKED